MPQVQNPSIGAGAAPLLMTTTQVTAAQILALKNTFIPVTPPPGAGNLIVPVVAVLSLDFGTNVYATAGDTLDIIYNGANQDNAFAQTVGLMASPSDGFSTVTAQQPQVAFPTTGDAGVGLALATFGVGFAFGPIVTATLGAGGAGYAINDTGTITNGANDATYKVLTVGGGGAVLTFQITGAGTRCAVANGNATVDGGAQPGVGAGFTVNITAVQTGDGTLKVVTYYQIIPVP